MQFNSLLVITFEFIDLILFLGISQGIFLAITIQLLKGKNKGANTILSSILLIAVVMLIGRMIYFRFLTPMLFRWTVLIDMVILIFGPLCYCYIRRLAFLENEQYRLPWIHFIPAGLHFLFFIYGMTFSLEDYIQKVNSGAFNLPFFIIEGGGILSNLFYWGLNVNLIAKYKREEKNRVSYSQNLISFLIIFQISIGVFLLVWLVSFIALKFFSYSLYPIGYDSLWVGLSVFIFVIGYYSLKEPELFRIPLPVEKTKSKSQRMPERAISLLKERLQHAIEEDKLYLQSNLTLRDLAQHLNTSTHNLSWYLNQVLQTNFYDYINHYRIKEFIKKIDNNEHHQHTILALSMDVGFNSKSTFNKAFKLEMNDTPSNYIKQLVSI